MGTGLASWTTAGKSSIWFILSACAGLKVAADQGITQVGVPAVSAEYSRAYQTVPSFQGQILGSVSGSDFIVSGGAL